ncbi:hypothetical protein MLD38_015082 [Melastoma candidum]|uniref:Uncharacterized protein n=1 Tax=Melastoma candidum TaxID=119954 RepID=A0ACB9RJ45_9MYRT|nr:hypothetical protein MLD38_015082 [Melastoma candidum]
MTRETMSFLRRRRGYIPDGDDSDVDDKHEKAGRKEKKKKKRDGGKRARWSCVDSCCWTVGFACSCWWLLMFVYNALPASFPQYVKEEITGGPMPDPPGEEVVGRNVWRTVQKVRDQTLSQMKSNIELMVATSGGKRVVVIPHSMGVLYFLHFMKWVEATPPMGSGGGKDWCAKHIKAIMNIGGPFLGVPKAVSGLFFLLKHEILLSPGLLHPVSLIRIYLVCKHCSI